MAPPPPPGSGKARKLLAGKGKAPKVINSAKFGTGMPKYSKADAKRLLVEALMEKRANRVQIGKGIWSAGQKAWKWWKGAPKTTPTPGPGAAGAGPVDRNLATNFGKGIRDSFKSKGGRETAKLQRDVLREQRRLTDDALNLPRSPKPKFDPSTYRGGMGGRPTASPRTQAIRDARQLAGPTPRFFVRNNIRAVNPRGPSPGQMRTARSQANIARNELAEGAGRFIGAGLRKGTKLVAGSTAIGAGVGGVYGAGKHLYTTGGMKNITGSTWAGMKEGAGAGFNPYAAATSGNLGKSTQEAIEAPLRGAMGKKPAHEMTAAERRVNKISDEAADMSSRYGTVKDANDFLQKGNRTYRFNKDWQKVDKGSVDASAVNNAFKGGGEMSPAAVEDSARMAEYTKMLRRRAKAKKSKTQAAQDALLQSSGK